MNLDATLHERLAILGGTGSGKSYTARGLAERVLKEGGRLGVIDPTGVWWGVRSGFPVVLFGGDHADLPLTESAGRLIGQAVATSQQSWIIDTSALKTKAAERRFMLDFLDVLFAENRAPITLIVDEADRFSPQRMSPETARLHERMEEIVRRGRVRGFTPWLITQRPASLNKDVLSQATAFICMRMTGVHDRNAIADAIEGQADKATAKAIVDAMPRHKVGSGMVWAPQQDLLLPVHFPKITTLDTMQPGAAQKHGNKLLSNIDVGALKDKLATIETETKANDPKALKARIAELEREKRSAQGVLGAGEADLKREYDRGRDEGSREMSKQWSERVERFRAAHVAAMSDLISPMPLLPPPKFQRVDIPHIPRAVSPPPAAPIRQPSPARSPQPRGNGHAKTALPKAERLILTVLAQRSPERVAIERVAAVAGYAVKGGGFNNAVGALRGKGYIEEGQPLAITADGMAALGEFEPLPVGHDLLLYWMGKVGKAERSILDAAARGLSTKEEIAIEAGYEVSGGGFNNALGRLRTLGLISGRGAIELHEDLR